MRNTKLFSMALAAVLVSATASRANIVAELESPVNLQVVSGVDLFRGWAFSAGEEDEEVNVAVVIDGIIDFTVPCCSPRQDVEDTFGAGTRLDSGFGAVINYAELSPGPHTIGVHLTADGEDTMVINHSVVVIRPGNTNFVDDFDLSGASCAIAGNTIMLTGVTIDGITTDLDAAYATDQQALILTGASGAPALTVFVANLTSNQEIPRVDTDSEGSATVTLNQDNTLTYAITTTSLEEATAAHIHLGSANENGAIQFTLTGGPTSWAGTTATLSEDQLTALREGRLYINVHTLENPNGEIRGTIVAAP
ncbi:MAG: CHRD domain-containing protein [Candidatus Binatia bacterium]